jgi:hypothetical protein
MRKSPDSPINDPRYRCGLFFSPPETADITGCLEDADQQAKNLSKANKDALVAVWDGQGQPLKLYIGDQELKVVPSVLEAQ